MRSKPLLLTASAAVAVLLLAIAGCTFTPTQPESAWPATGGDRPTFYYFGDPG